MPLTNSEEAKLRVFCRSHNIPTHVQARSRQIADAVCVPSLYQIKSELWGDW